MQQRTHKRALAWLRDTYEAEKYNSPLCRYLLSTRHAAYRVMLKRLYRETLDASVGFADPQKASVAGAAMAQNAYRELLGYVIAQLFHGRYLTGWKSGDKQRNLGVLGSDHLDVLLMLGGVHKAACADIRGKAKEIRLALACAQQRLDEDPACVQECAWRDVHNLVDTLLTSDIVPTNRNKCERLLEMREDYLRGDVVLGGTDRHTAETWIESEQYLESFSDISKNMLTQGGDSDLDELTEGASSRADVVLTGFFYEGYTGGRRDKAQQNAHLKDLFRSSDNADFAILTYALASYDAADLLGKLERGAKTLDSDLLRLYMEHGGAVDAQPFNNELMERALDAYDATCTQPSCLGVFVPLSASTDVGGADVPVGVYIAGRKKFEALVLSEERVSKLDKLGNSKTTVVVFDPYVDQMLVVSNSNLSAFISPLPQKPKPQNPKPQNPNFEFMHKFLFDRHTPSELRRAIRELFEQREEYALECLGRMRKNNGSAPTGLPNELAAFFGSPQEASKDENVTTSV